MRGLREEKHCIEKEQLFPSTHHSPKDYRLGREGKEENWSWGTGRLAELLCDWGRFSKHFSLPQAEALGARWGERLKKILNEIIGSESGKCLYPLPLPPYSKAEKQQNQSPLECPHLCWSTGFRDPSSLTDICALGGMGALEWPLTDQSSGNLGTLCMDSGTPDRNEDASFIGWRMTHSRYPSYPVSGDTVPPQQLTHKEERDPPWLWLFPHNTHWVWLFGDYMKSYILNP